MLLFVGPFTIIIFVVLLLSLVVTALVLASKNESNVKFLIWGAIILLVPFLGALACIISYYSNKKEVKTA